MKLKIISDIKQIYARDNGFCEWSDVLYGTDDPAEVDEHFDNVSKLFAKEVAREALKNASDNACLIESIRNSAVYDTIDKQSILNEKNIPEL